MGAKVNTDASLAKPYARAVFSYAKSCSKVDYSLDLWDICLSVLSQLVEQDRVIEILTDPDILQTQKIDFLLGMLFDAIKDNFLKKLSLKSGDFAKGDLKDPLDKISNFIKLIFENNRVLLLPAINDYFADLLFEYRKKLLVEVSSAEKLSAKNLAGLKDLLEKKYDQAIQIETVIDPSLIAGLKVKVGDHIIDGSVRSKLDRLSYQLCEDLV
jgi:F-type H+-transporting ATPase subunit delta